MKNSGNIITGGILLAGGLLWLLKSMDLFVFRWHEIFSYWYWYLIIAGVLLLISGITRNTLAGGLSGIFITLAIIGGVVHGAHRELRGISYFDDADARIKSEKRIEKRKNRKARKAPNEQEIKKNYGYDLPDNLQTSRLNFTGGAGVFNIEGGSERLFEADISSTFVNYISKYQESQTDKSAVIDFNMENGEIDVDRMDSDNTVHIQLNDQIAWDINLKFGAGEGRFDFRNTNVQKLEMSTGAADVMLTLGDKSEHTQVDISAGVASVEIKVPQNASVEIRSSGALNSTEFPGFKRVDKGVYRSPDYDTSGKKITIKYKAGLSSLRVERYN